MATHDLDYYFSQTRRIAEHREKEAEKAIRKMYREMLKELQGFLGQEYAALAEDDQLTYAILQAKGQNARFLEEVQRNIDNISPRVMREITAAVEETYKTVYAGMVEAVEKSSNLDELKINLEGVKGVTAETVKAAVENPISGLTLSDTLEKHRKEVIYEIKQQIGIGLTQGDRYSTMARRVSDRLNMDYRKSVRIVRTEAHRVREAGAQDSAAAIQDKLKDADSEYRLVKIWRTAQDERVRPQRAAYKRKAGTKARKKNTAGLRSSLTAPNHVKMEGQTVLVDEPFDLGGGAKAMAPGLSGVAGHDINCRCKAVRRIMTDAEFYEATGRHFPGWTDKPNNPYIIEDGSLPPAIYEYRNYEDYRDAIAEWRKMHSGSPYDYFCDNSIWDTSDASAEQIGRMKRFDATIAKLQSDYPLNTAHAKQLYIGTYENMGVHLSDIQRSRMDDSGIAQAQFWFNPDNDVAVIGFRSAGVSGNLADDLLIREKKIKNGEVLSAVLDNSPEGTAIHEWGHGFTNVIMNEMVYDNPAAHDYWEWYKSLSKEDIAQGISAYATTNRGEFEAECFAELLTGNPRPIAKRFGEFLDRCYKDSLERLEKYGADAVKSGTAGAIQYSLALIRDTSSIKTVVLPKKEYAHVMSEIATNMNEWEKKQPIVTKAIGKFRYTYENNGFGDYRIIMKQPIVDEIERVWRE